MRIRSEEPGVRQIEHGAGPLFNTTKVSTLPISSAARAIVYIDGIPYAGFVDDRDGGKVVRTALEVAQDFVELVVGDVDGHGRKVSKHHGAHWPAIIGKRIEARPA